MADERIVVVRLTNEDDGLSEQFSIRVPTWVTRTGIRSVILSHFKQDTEWAN